MTGYIFSVKYNIISRIRSSAVESLFSRLGEKVYHCQWRDFRELLWHVERHLIMIRIFLKDRLDWHMALKRMDNVGVVAEDLGGTASSTSIQSRFYFWLLMKVGYRSEIRTDRPSRAIRQLFLGWKFIMFHYIASSAHRIWGRAKHSADSRFPVVNCRRDSHEK